MKNIQINNHEVSITHPDKVLFPKSKITKWDLANYYLKISDYILPMIKDHPLTIHCFSGGIENEGFYRQHAPRNLPYWFKTCELERKMGGSINHILCQNTKSLIYLVNYNMISIHRWLSNIKNPTFPEVLVVDIDSSSTKFSSACKGARLIKTSLELKGYKPYVMLTGSNGLHVVSKVLHNRSFIEIRQMLHEITENIANQYSNEFSINIRKESRHDLTYLDIMRNAYGQTSITPFSVRSIEGAPIATPITWEELDEDSLTADKYKIENIFQRLSQLKTNPWDGY